MNINNIFEPTRFGKYFLKNFNENKKGLLFQSISIILLLTFFLLRVQNTNTDSFYATSTVFLIGLVLLIAGSKYASSFSKQINLRGNKVMYLMVPASTFEKLLTQIVNITILFPFIFTVCLLIAQYLSPLFYSLFWGGEIVFKTPFEELFPYYGEEGTIGVTTATLFFFYIANVSIFLLGATIWKKNCFLKTFIALVSIHILFSICGSIFIMHTDLSNISNIMEHNLRELSKENINLIAKLFYSFITLTVWGISYLRLSELEINETKW